MSIEEAPSTPLERLGHALDVVSQQRADGWLGRAPTITDRQIETMQGNEFVPADDYFDLRHELQRLQAAVLGEPDPAP